MRVPAPPSAVAVVGLGYVGLPLAVEFGRWIPTVGYDVADNKITVYQSGRDPSGTVSREEFAGSRYLRFTSNPSDLGEADVVIVAVPTPVDHAHIPDFGPLIGASRTVGQHMKRGATVVFESTVYPGATEEVCIPELEKASGLRWKSDFSVGYSPERVNPGDRSRTLRDIVKVVSGDTPDTASMLATLYGRIVEAGVHLASSIRVAEAAKVIENTQRDLNIALMNELAIVFGRLGLDTSEVLEAAATKWNFLPFRPGLVGGHCIGVDPYYLTHKAEMVGYHPQVILAGRRINDGMAAHVADMTIRHLVSQGGCHRGDAVTVLGLTFKEDCPDIRNSKVADLIGQLLAYGLDVSVHDPIADPHQALEEYTVALRSWDELPARPRAVIVAVAHREYKIEPDRVLRYIHPGTVVMDVKAILDPRAVRDRGGVLWRL